MGLIQWKSVRWRGGDGYSGFVDGDMTCMIYPVAPDDDLPLPYAMKLFSEIYDPDACRTGRHIAIQIDSLEEGQRRADEILKGGISRQ